jgi:Fe2+ transport system protein FeoA
VAEKLLRELDPGDEGRIVKIGGSGSIRRRMMDMGVVKGTPFRVERVAPLGDPMEILIKGYHLSLRREEAAQITVEVD